MYKNLNCELLGITGRQSEIIELALTYGFQGINIDMDDLVKRCARTSFESATRFLLSSKLRVAGFDAPIDLDDDEEAYATRLAQLNGVAEIAQRAEMLTAYVGVPAATNRLPYPEYFDVIRTRIDQVASVLAKENIKLALYLMPAEAISEETPEETPEEKQFKFIADAEGFAALIRSITNENVGIAFDSWAWHLGGGTVDSLKELGVSRVCSVQLSDCREGVEISAATEDDCILPATSTVINNVGYLQAFAEAGLDLPVAGRGNPAEGKATRDALISLAQDALDKSFQDAGLPSVTRKPETFANNGNSYASNS